MALPAGRKGVLPSELTPEGRIKNITPPYVLPTASAETLGGVKVGSGLSIEDGVLSVDDSGMTIHTYEYSLGVTSFGAKEIKGNFVDVSLNDIPANAVIVSAMMKPTGGTSPQMITPLLGRNADGKIHIGFMNMYDGTASFTGKLIIYYYEED